MNKVFNDTQLLIVGDGHLKSDLKRMVKNLGIEKNVEFFGTLTREKMPIVFNSAHCLIMGSRKETFGVVFIEALACGIPIIATKCDGPLHIVQKENGLLVNIEDAQGMYDAMKFLYKNIKTYDANKIRNKAKEKYSKEIVSEAIIDVYDNLSNECELR